MKWSVFNFLVNFHFFTDIPKTKNPRQRRGFRVRKKPY
jgi:hypothetical protein